MQKIGQLVWGARFENFDNRFTAIITRYSLFNISGRPKDSAIKFSGLVDTLNVFCGKCSKLGVSPKFGPQGGSNFHIGPLRRAPWRTNLRTYGDLAMLLW